MTWTSKKHGELVRLFKEFIHEHYKHDTPFRWLGCDFVGDEGEDLTVWGFALSEIEKRRPDDARVRKVDEMFPDRLRGWCDAVERHYDKKPHPAIEWLVKQYYDYAKKEKMMTAFRNLWGGGSQKSIARRIYNKAKKEGEFDLVEWAEETTAMFDRAAKEADGDLYKFTFHTLGTWPEPSMLFDDHRFSQWFERRFPRM